jgi:predicted nucleic acid-binding Zn ribbon protein
MKKFGIRFCDYCSKEFEPIRYDQRFCKRECHDQFFMEERRRALAAWRGMNRYPQMIVGEDEGEAEVA